MWYSKMKTVWPQSSHFKVSSYKNPDYKKLGSFLLLIIPTKFLLNTKYFRKHNLKLLADIQHSIMVIIFENGMGDMCSNPEHISLCLNTLG